MYLKAHQGTFGNYENAFKGEGGLRFCYTVWFFRAETHSNVVTDGRGGLKTPFFALRNFGTFPYIKTDKNYKIVGKVIFLAFFYIFTNKKYQQKINLL